MSVVLEIPDQVAHAIRLPVSEQQQALMTELAVALYARGMLSFGKARELTSLNRIEFGRLLGRREISRHNPDFDNFQNQDCAQKMASFALLA